MKRLLLLALPLALSAQEGVDFARWSAYLRPKPPEVAWKDLDWKYTLADGVREGRKKGIPVLFWLMNGHPAGIC